MEKEILEEDRIESLHQRILNSEGYKEAMEDIENGRVYHADTVEQLFADCLA